MRCIFCKQSSTDSKSIEHIIPESLGNTEHILPPGVVCDGCNNYLSREVEKPFLESGFIRHDRFEMGVPSKRRNIPSLVGLMRAPLVVPLELVRRADDPGMTFVAFDESLEADALRALRANPNGQIIVPLGEEAPNSIQARFFGKVGLEVLASRVLEVPGGLDDVVDNPGLDELRSFVRRGYPRGEWPVHKRRLYACDSLFAEDGDSFQVLHEYMLVYTSSLELFVIIAIFGVEYAMNLGGRSTEGYVKWLIEHGQVSPLYC